MDSSDDRWNALLRVTRSWRLEWNLKQLLSKLACEAAQFLKLERSVVFLLDTNGPSVHAQWPESAGGKPLVPEAAGIAQEVLNTGRPIFAHALASGGGPQDSGLACCVPLTASRGILGALYVDSPKAKSSLTSQDQQLLEMLALHAAVALEHAMLYHSAITDPLTGLFTHRHFQREVEQSVRHALRAGNSVSLVLLDLDHFKQLNDSSGHDAGNQCLTRVADVLRNSLRATDTVARFGGDEFEILLPNTPRAAAEQLAEKIRRKIAQLPQSGQVQVTSTFGVASFPANAADAQALFLRADEALYAAKEAGRNCTASSKVQVSASTPQERSRQLSAQAQDSEQVLNALRLQPAQAEEANAGSAAAALVREQIDGHAVVRRLGVGTSGEVLLVQQAELGREIALKRPLTPHLSATQLLAFEREARVTASLDHPGVITVLTMGRDADQRRYYTMKQLRGQSLEQILAQRSSAAQGQPQPCSTERLLEIVQRTAETIAYAHQRGVLHLDLTPGNIMVGEFGEVTVIDWGRGASGESIGASPLDLRRRGMVAVVGSPTYMAPEQMPGSRVRPSCATDVFALGALLYHILTGYPPYQKKTLRLTLEAIRDGALIKPEEAAPGAAIDPALSALCVEALNPKSVRRLSAREFAERVGRYVRKEREWSITRFSEGIKPSEWQVCQGDWQLKNGQWRATGPGENRLLWRSPVHGDFKFICEGVVEKATELAIFGCAPSMHNQLHAMSGYMFQFGANWGGSTRLYRRVTIPGLRPEPGRRYRLELECSGGWIYCSIDGKRVISYRELFAQSGSHIGLYTYSPGARFRPIEVHRQRWGRQLSALCVADKFYEQQLYQLALEMYSDIAAQSAKSADATEAQLKRAICLQHLGQWQSARKILRGLRHTPLANYALAYEALAELADHPQAQAARGLSLYRTLVKEFPTGITAAQVNEGVSKALRKERFDSAHLNVCAQLAQLGSAVTEPNSQWQAQCELYRTYALWNLGHWREVLSVMLALHKKMDQRIFVYAPAEPVLVVAALALGRDEMLPRSPFELKGWTVPRCRWSTGILLHCAVRKNCLTRFLKDLKKGRRCEVPDATIQSRLAVALCHLARRELRQAGEYLFSELLPNLQEFFTKGAAGDVLYPIGSSLVESGSEELFERLITEYEARHAGEPNIAELYRHLKVRWALEHCRFEQAATLARQDCSQPISKWWHLERSVLNAFLYSLKLLPRSARRSVLNYPNCMAGVPLDLVRMFLGRKPARPGALWPHPAWRPEWRLWLGLWLEARGRRPEARRLLKPTQVYDYGFTHCQPAIEALLARTGS